MTYRAFVKDGLYRVTALSVVARSMVAQRHPQKIENCVLLIRDDISLFKLSIAFFAKIL